MVLELTNNYQIVSDCVNKILKKRYEIIERYLENILDSPSTINRIIKYYRIGHSEDYSEIYLLFGNTIIRRYGITKEDYYRDLRISIWVECGLQIQIPEPIMYVPK